MIREEAWNLLTEYNKEPFHLHHAEVVEGLMRYFAVLEGFADEADFWGVVGLLHDLDFEQYPQEHCAKEQQLMQERGIEPRIIHAVASHGYAIVNDIFPEHRMEKILYAVDELSGLVGATALMLPSKSVADLQIKTLRKKYRQPSFAAGCSREVIARGAELLGWTLDELLEKTLDAMKALGPLANAK